MFPEYSIPYAVLLSETDENSLRYKLTEPTSNFKALYDFFKSVKKNKYTIWPDWAVNLDGFEGGDAWDLYRAAADRGDFYTALCAIINHWHDSFEEYVLVDEAYDFYNLYMKNNEAIEAELEKMCKMGLSTEIALVFNMVFNSLDANDYENEAQTLARTFNRISRNTRPVGEDWLSDEEFNDVLRVASNNDIVKQLGFTNEETDFEEVFKYARENFVGVPSLIAAYAMIKENVPFSDEAYVEVYLTLLEEPGVKSGFSKKGIFDFVDALTKHFTEVEDFEKVAHLHDFLTQKVGFDVE